MPDGDGLAGFGVVGLLSLFVSNVGIIGVLWALMVALAGLVFSFYLLVWMYRFDEGTDAMQVIIAQELRVVYIG